MERTFFNNQQRERWIAWGTNLVLDEIHFSEGKRDKKIRRRVEVRRALFHFRQEIEMFGKKKSDKVQQPEKNEFPKVIAVDREIVVRGNLPARCLMKKRRTWRSMPTNAHEREARFSNLSEKADLRGNWWETGGRFGTFVPKRLSGNIHKNANPKSKTTNPIHPPLFFIFLFPFTSVGCFAHYLFNYLRLREWKMM